MQFYFDHALKQQMLSSDNSFLITKLADTSYIKYEEISKNIEKKI